MQGFIRITLAPLEKVHSETCPRGTCDIRTGLPLTQGVKWRHANQLPVLAWSASSNREGIAETTDTEGGDP